MKPADENDDFVRRFLYGPGAAIARGADGRVAAELHLAERLEGWIGIPHGGIGMGALIDLALLPGGDPGRDDGRFPVSAAFQLAGASVGIGERLRLEVLPVPGGADGSATVARDPRPYMTASIRHRQGGGPAEAFSAYMPERCGDPPAERDALPVYRNCFVCGCERRDPGLERRFYLSGSPERTVVSRAGFSAADGESFYRFSRAGFLHPLPLIALLDEILGWGGFMISASGAVTVEIGFTLVRPVRRGERLLFFGRGERLRGRSGSRLLYWASGGAAAVGEDGRLEMVAGAAGQWFGVPDLTRQMRSFLQPRERMERIFELAAAPRQPAGGGAGRGETGAATSSCRRPRSALIVPGGA